MDTSSTNRRPRVPLFRPGADAAPHGRLLRGRQSGGAGLGCGRRQGGGGEAAGLRGGKGRWGRWERTLGKEPQRWLVDRKFRLDDVHQRAPFVERRPFGDSEVGGLGRIWGAFGKGVRSERERFGFQPKYGCVS